MKKSSNADSILDATHKVSVIKIKYSGLNVRNKQKQGERVREWEYTVRDDNGKWEGFFEL